MATTTYIVQTAAAKMPNSRKQRRMELIASLAATAKRYDEQGDVVLRDQTANEWRELATEAQAKRAPAYLTWAGRRGEQARWAREMAS